MHDAVKEPAGQNEPASQLQMPEQLLSAQPPRPKLPIAQRTGCAAAPTQNEPTGHGKQVASELAAGQKYPAGQLQSPPHSAVELLIAVSCPRTPIGHATGGPAPPAQYAFTAHEMQAAPDRDVEPDGQYLPAVQLHTIGSREASSQ